MAELPDLRIFTTEQLEALRDAIQVEKNQRWHSTYQVGHLTRALERVETFRNRLTHIVSAASSMNYSFGEFADIEEAALSLRTVTERARERVQEKLAEQQALRNIAEERSDV